MALILRYFYDNYRNKTQVASVLHYMFSTLTRILQETYCYVTQNRKRVLLSQNVRNFKKKREREKSFLQWQVVADVEGLSILKNNGKLYDCFALSC